MQTPEAALIQTFYDAFAKRDYATMGACYHDEATFSDPAFPNLNAAQVRAMWQMLCERSTELKVVYSELKADGNKGSVRWDAYYPFGAAKRKVHNIIHASFEFKDGKIYRHIDSFNFYRWSRQALGAPGLLLGWTGFLKKKVQGTAMESLHKYMNKSNIPSL